MSLTGLAFLAAFFAGLGLAFVRHPIYGLYTYVAVFYLHPPSRWWGATLPDLRWALFAAAVTLLATLRLPPNKIRPAWYSTTPARILIIFTIWVWIQNLWAISPDQHLELSILYTKYILLFFLIYRLLETPEQIRDFLMVNLAGCGYLGWVAFTSPVSGRLEGVGGPGIDEANALAMQLGTAVMIGAMFMLVERKWRLWFCFATMPFVLNGIILSGSRSAFLAIVVSGLLLWYLKPRAHRTLFYGYAFLALILLGMLAHETFWERMGTMKAGVDESQEMDTSAESRIHLIYAQWEMAKAQPFGTGHRGTEVLSPFYLDEKYMSRTHDPNDTGQRSSHNTFMSALVEQGWFGAVLFTWLLLWWWKMVRAFKRREEHTPPPVAAMSASVSAALGVVFVAGMFVDYLKAEIMIWLLVVGACLLQLESKSEPLKLPSRLRSARIR